MMDTDYWVDAAPFRRHIRYLIAATGLSWRLIAAHANIAPRAVRTLLHGRPHTGRPVHRIHLDTARALMALDVNDLLAADSRRTCTGDTRPLFRTLLDLGYDTSQLNTWLTPDDIRLLSNRREVWCSAGTHARVQACHDFLTEQPIKRPARQPRPTNPTGRRRRPAQPPGKPTAGAVSGRLVGGAFPGGQL